MAEELTLALVEPVPYRIYYHGNVPLLSDEDQLNNTASHQVRSVQALGASVFASLPVHSEHRQLQSLELALRTQFVGWRYGFWCLLVVLLLSLAYGVQQWAQPPPMPVVALPAPQKIRCSKSAVSFCVRTQHRPHWMQRVIARFMCCGRPRSRDGRFMAVCVHWQDAGYDFSWRARSGETSVPAPMGGNAAGCQVANGVDQQANLHSGVASLDPQSREFPKIQSGAWCGACGLQDGLAKFRFAHRVRMSELHETAGVAVLAVDLRLMLPHPWSGSC